DNKAILQKAQKSLQTARAKLEARREELRPLVTRRLQKQALAASQQALEAQQEKVGRLEGVAKTLDHRFKECLEQIKTLGEQIVDLEGKKIAIAEVEEIAKQIGKRAVALRVEIDAPTRITPMGKTVTSQTRDRGQQVKRTALAGVGCFAL